MITKEQFEKYEAVRDSGVTNMFDIGRVGALSGLTREQIIVIMQNYELLLAKFQRDELEPEQ